MTPDELRALGEDIKNGLTSRCLEMKVAGLEREVEGLRAKLTATVET
jgi:hypothetical protein